MQCYFDRPSRIETSKLNIWKFYIQFFYVSSITWKPGPLIWRLASWSPESIPCPSASFRPCNRFRNK
jgi:hypothetical protein